jgi:glycosyltransferase involved in cell wall biosynthesis
VNVSLPPAVTAVVLTRDEERHLPDCLDSLTWADDRLVLDSGSVDATTAIARGRGARVVEHAFENFSRQRQHALGLVTTPWVLFVDADERVPSALATEVRRVLGRTGACGYWIPRRNIFWGHVMRGGGWSPDYQLRLLRTERARYDGDRAVHEVAEVDGPTDRLTTSLVHLNYDSPAEFRTRQESYARLEAVRRHARGDRVRPRNLVLQPAREFARRFVTLGGWRDGATGIVVCTLAAWYELRALRHLADLTRPALPVTTRAGRR